MAKEMRRREEISQHKLDIYTDFYNQKFGLKKKASRPEEFLHRYTQIVYVNEGVKKNLFNKDVYLLKYKLRREGETGQKMQDYRKKKFN